MLTRLSCGALLAAVAAGGPGPATVEAAWAACVPAGSLLMEEASKPLRLGSSPSPPKDGSGSASCPSTGRTISSAPGNQAIRFTGFDFSV